MNYQTINSIYLPEPNSDSVLTHSTMTWPRAWASAYRSFSPFLNSMSSTFLATSSHSQAAHGRYGASATPLNSQSLSHFFYPDCIMILSARELHPWDTWHLQHVHVMSVLTPALLASYASCPPVSRPRPNFHPDSRQALNRPGSQNRPGQQLMISLINKAMLTI